MILPALTEAKSPFWRPIKSSLFPPLGLATLAAYCSPGDEIDLRELKRQDLRQHPQASLRDAVGAGTVQGRLLVDRRHVDDATAPALHHAA